MNLISPAFLSKSFIPHKYTCKGENISPPLEILNKPHSVSSFALIMEDPDAPSKTWTHWLVWNIPAETKIIAEGTIPQGAIEGTTDFGTVGYGGPCPPSGTHLYFFKLYAVSYDIQLPVGSNKQALLSVIENNVITETELIGLYSHT